MKLILAIFIATLSLSSMAKIRDVGNGGDAVVLEFKNLARQVSRDISLNADYLFPEFTVEQLDQAIESTKVVSATKTVLRGVEKDAINYPASKLIKVSRSRWKLNSDSIESLQALVLHEYLGIMGVEDSHFKISGRLLSYYQKSKKTIFDYELQGRFFLTDQEDANTQGLITLESSNKITFTGTIAGEQLSCFGEYEFNFNRQVVAAKMSCGDFKGQFMLNFWNTDVVDFLRKGLIQVDLGFIKSTGDLEEILIQKTIDAKHLN